MPASSTRRTCGPALLLAWIVLALLSAQPSVAQLGVTATLAATAQCHTHLNFTATFERAVSGLQPSAFELDGCEFRSNLTAASSPSLRDRQWSGTVRAPPHCQQQMPETRGRRPQPGQASASSLAAYPTTPQPTPCERFVGWRQTGNKKAWISSLRFWGGCTRFDQPESYVATGLVGEAPTQVPCF